MKHYEQLTNGQRSQIELLRKQGKEPGAIGQGLQRSKNTTSRELLRVPQPRGASGELVNHNFSEIFCLIHLIVDLDRTQASKEIGFLSNVERRQKRTPHSPVHWLDRGARIALNRRHFKKWENSP